MTLALGAAGAAIATWLRIPAAGLVGSAIAVGGGAVLRIGVTMSEPMRDLAFAAIGISIGANVSNETLGSMARWPVSLAALIVSIAATTAASTWYLSRTQGWDRDTALLSSTPGALSMAVALAAQGYGDPRLVSATQTIRLMTLTVGLPLLLGAGGSGIAPATAMPIAAVVALLGCTFVAGQVLRRIHVPTPLLIGGIAVTAGAHLTGLAPGVLPQVAALPAFVITGSFVGARLGGITGDELRTALRASLVMVALTTAISALFAALVAHQMAFPFAQTLVAFAPGGAETMSAMAIALGYDQAYIGSHHVLRILLLSAALPLALASSERFQSSR